MTEAQLIHLAHPTMHHKLQATRRNWGFTVSHFHARETTINEEMPGYFRSIRMTNLDTLLQMCNLGNTKLGKKLTLNGVWEKKKRSLETDEDLPLVKLCLSLPSV